ncbi:MAG: PilZ domain-containing protein [Methylococcaceae bacterium]|nr:PilZ domain-containing protein [Methylococcaceae bacterium]
MNLGPSRPHRRNLTSHGLIYMGGEEQGITVKNISITGLLAELNCNSNDRDIKSIFDSLLVSTVIDLYLPELRLAGEAEVIRVDLKDNHILIALEFKNVTYEVDNLLYKRKAYRKSMPGPGQILLGGKYHEFDAVNVSVEGIMIRIDEKITVEEGIITVFEFKRLDLAGEIKIIWVDPIADSGTLIGLQYVNMKKMAVKGIPRFTPPA